MGTACIIINASVAAALFSLAHGSPVFCAQAASAAAAETIAKMATGAAHQSQNASADSGAASSQSLPAGPTPRLVVEARLGVDYRDDGYHWRKYGQKNVKGRGSLSVPLVFSFSLCL